MGLASIVVSLGLAMNSQAQTPDSTKYMYVNSDTTEFVERFELDEVSVRANKISDVEKQERLALRTSNFSSPHIANPRLFSAAGIGHNMSAHIPGHTNTYLGLFGNLENQNIAYGLQSTTSNLVLATFGESTSSFPGLDIVGKQKPELPKENKVLASFFEQVFTSSVIDSENFKFAVDLQRQDVPGFIEKAIPETAILETVYSASTLTSFNKNQVESKIFSQFTTNQTGFEDMHGLLSYETDEKSFTIFSRNTIEDVTFSGIYQHVSGNLHTEASHNESNRNRSVTQKGVSLEYVRNNTNLGLLFSNIGRTSFGNSFQQSTADIMAQKDIINENYYVELGGRAHVHNPNFSGDITVYIPTTSFDLEFFASRQIDRQSPLAIRDTKYVEVAPGDKNIHHKIGITAKTKKIPQIEARVQYFTGTTNTKVEKTRETNITGLTSRLIAQYNKDNFSINASLAARNLTQEGKLYPTGTPSGMPTFQADIDIQHQISNVTWFWNLSHRRGQRDVIEIKYLNRGNQTLASTGINYATKNVSISANVQNITSLFTESGIGAILKGREEASDELQEQGVGHEPVLEKINGFPAGGLEIIVYF